ncbi:hypothetical protein GCM10022393_16100 [Aquimarina addita]|uniref:Secretion system C-terminal sorting domain-containing protein n=1 Tax=Aquimarina addita TaxID=870485 RepID=A0ABP7XGJ3_9FLAO
MKKIYLLLIFIGIFSVFCTSELQAQSPLSKDEPQEKVQIFPNPTTSSIVYITSESGKSKTVSVFTALGKQILFKVMTTNVLDISSLTQGVYVFRVKIGDHSSVQKVIVN